MDSRPKKDFLNVLLADDEAGDRLIFEETLRVISIATKLIAVNDGEQLTKYLNQNSEQLPDIIFLDISMPGKTGVECLSEIKGNPKLKHIPVFIFTIAVPRQIEFEISLKKTLSNIGANGFITKTSNLTLLRQSIQNALLKAYFPSTGNF